jgi:hypothetical protein
MIFLIKGDRDDVDDEDEVRELTTGTENNQLNIATESNLSPVPRNVSTTNPLPNPPCQVERPQPTIVELDPSESSSNVTTGDDEINLLFDEGNSIQCINIVYALILCDKLYLSKLCHQQLGIVYY